MKYFKSATIFLPWDDIQEAWEKNDIFYLQTKDKYIIESPNGKQEMKNYQMLKKIHELKKYIDESPLTLTKVANEINVAQSTLRFLFYNSTLSKEVEEKIRAKYPDCFSD